MKQNNILCHSAKDLRDRIADQDRERGFAPGCRPFFTEKEPPALSPGAANPDCAREDRRTVSLSDKALKGNGDMRDLRRTFRHLPMIPGGLPTEVSDDD